MGLFTFFLKPGFLMDKQHRARAFYRQLVRALSGIHLVVLGIQQLILGSSLTWTADAKIDISTLIVLLKNG